MDEGTKKMRLNLVAQWIKAQAESGLTKEQWMKENHISRWTFVTGKYNTSTIENSQMI